MQKNNNLKTALITGATGFVGQHLSQRLLKTGWAVHAVVREQSDLSRLDKNIVLHFHNSADSNLNEIMAAVMPDTVFHLASLFLSAHKFENIADLIQSNITFGTQLVDAMAQNGITKLVNTGTSWQHYQNGEYNPVCLYAATKQAFEMMLKYYQETASLEVITLKLFDTYGLGDHRPKLFNLLQRIACSDELLAMSAGEQHIDLVYIDDVLDAFCLSAEYLLAGEKRYYKDYAVTSGEVIKLVELVSVYEKLLGKKLNIEWGKRPYRLREVMVPWDKGVTLPGWSPRISLIDGIKKILD